MFADRRRKTTETRSRRAPAWLDKPGARRSLNVCLDLRGGVGEKIDIGSEVQADLPLYSSATLASKPVTTVAPCTTVVVRKVGGTPDERWYFVETPEGDRGWVSDKVTAADIRIG